jgi:hypothetical protein
MSTRSSRASTHTSSRALAGPVSKWRKRWVVAGSAAGVQAAPGALRVCKWAKVTEGDVGAARSTRGQRSAPSTLAKVPQAAAGGSPSEVPPAAEPLAGASEASAEASAEAGAAEASEESEAAAAGAEVPMDVDVSAAEAPKAAEVSGVKPDAT